MKLSRRIASDTSVSEDETQSIKTALAQMGLYEIPSYGLTPYPDQAMFDGITKLQNRLGLETTGSMRPGGIEELVINDTLSYRSSAGASASTGSVHVRAYEQTRHGHDVRVAEYDRSLPSPKASDIARPKAHVLDNLKGHEDVPYLNDKGNAECVTFIQKAMGAPRTSLWKEGQKIRKLAPGEPDPIAPGTAIATFVDGAYPQSGSTGKHAAVYLGQNQNGIQVLDQWRKQGQVSERTIPWSSTRPGLSNDGKAFSVIEW